MRSIVFASGKGGVGKTSITVNLGLTLAKQGKNVVVIDADLDMANVSILLGIELTPITLHNILSGENTILDAVYEGPQKLKYVPAGLAEKTEDLDYSKLRTAVSKLELSSDYILLDCPSGLGEDAKAAITSSRELVLVLTPEPASIVDALKVKQFAERSGVKVIGVALNRVTGEHAELKAQDVASVLELPVLASLPEDSEVRKSSLVQEPVVIRAPNASFCKALRVLASALTSEPTKEEAYSPSFLQKLKDFFNKLFKRS